MELPDLEGQPPWVVVVVFGLFVFGVVGVAYIRRRARSDDDDEDESREVEGKPVTLSLPAGADAPFDPVKEAIGIAVANASRAADEADRAEEEAKLLAKQLAACERERAVLEERLQTKTNECVILSAQLDACRQRSAGGGAA